MLYKTQYNYDCYVYAKTKEEVEEEQTFQTIYLKGIFIGIL